MVTHDPSPPILAAVYVVGALALAILLVATQRRRPNVLLALVLACFACSSADALVNVLPGAAVDPRVSYNATLLLVAGHLAIPFAYLAFFGTVLDTPLVAPLRWTPVRWALYAATLCALAVPFLAPTFFVTGPSAIVNGVRDWSYGPLGAAPLTTLRVLAYSVGIVCAVAAMKRAPRGTTARRRARAYAAAFVVQDVSALMFNIGGAWLALGLPASWLDVAAFAADLGLLLALALLVRALLKWQLFDFELKVKWTLRRGTVVGAFVVVFVIVAEVAQVLVSNEFGILAGLVAAGLLFLAKRPLERAADRLADKAMPRVQDNDEYKLVRKREVYRAAVESVLQDGVITEKERLMLTRLRDELGVVAAEAASIEREATGT